jgi:hypothetical protein
MTTSERAAQDGTTAADLDGTTTAADLDGTTTAADQVDPDGITVDPAVPAGTTTADPAGTTTGRAALKDTGRSPT